MPQLPDAAEVPPQIIRLIEDMIRKDPHQRIRNWDSLLRRFYAIGDELFGPDWESTNLDSAQISSSSAQPRNVQQFTKALSYEPPLIRRELPETLIEDAGTTQERDYAATTAKMVGPTQDLNHTATALLEGTVPAAEPFMVPVAVMDLEPDRARAVKTQKIELLTAPEQTPRLDPKLDGPDLLDGRPPAPPRSPSRGKEAMIAVMVFALLIVAGAIVTFRLLKPDVASQLAADCSSRWRPPGRWASRSWKLAAPMNRAKP
jgi:hypothetical protein